MLNLGLIDLLDCVYTEISDSEKAKAEAAQEAEATKLAEAEAAKAAEAEAAEKAKLDDEEMVPMKDLRAIRSEAASYRKQLRELETEVDASTKAQEKAAADAEIAKLEGVEAEKARTLATQKELDDANATIAVKDAKLKADAISTAVYRAANTAGFLNPEDAIKLLDAESIDVTDGVVDDEAIDEMIITLSESRPNLLAGDADDAGVGGGPSNPKSRQNPPGPKLTDEKKIAQMRTELADKVKSGELSGLAIIQQRRRIREAQSGKSIQRERGG